MFPECQTCRGSGEASHLTVEVGYSVPCHTCAGLGVLIPEELREQSIRAATSVFGFRHPSDVEALIDAVLAAVVAYQKEQENR